VDGTHAVGAKSGLSMGQLGLLIRRPSWVVGTLLLTLAIVIQLISLGFAPLIVVQPLGVVAMVLTNVINSRVNGIAPDARVRGSIALAVLGIGIFVAFSAVYAFERALSEEQLLFIMWLLACRDCRGRGRVRDFSSAASSDVLHRCRRGRSTDSWSPSPKS